MVKSDLEYLIVHPGFQAYKAELQREFDIAYKKLRKCPRDSAFYRTQGLLDGLEMAMNLPNKMINRGEL